MANIKYVVELTLEEHEALLAKIKRGTLSARANCKARILLKADKGPHGEGWTDRVIWQSLETSPSTVTRVRETFVLEGLEAVFARKQRSHPRRLAPNLTTPLIVIANAVKRSMAGWHPASLLLRSVQRWIAASRLRAPRNDG